MGSPPTKAATAAPNALASFFLSTKIALPKVPARWIERARLIERLGVPPAARVTLLHAGPGFGKTACLAQWQKALTASGVRVAWLSIDSDDDDVATFLGYLAASLNAADGAIGADVMELSRGGPMPGSEALLNPLLNQVAASSERYLLVIDDLHSVRSQAIDDVLSNVVAHAPDNLDVAIAARSLPNLRLAKLRAEGKVQEIGPETLGLTRAETAALAEAALGTTLSARDIAQLQTISEGWPAVLQMMLVALGGKKHLQSLVRGFTGEARVLREYLAQEAFEGLPADAQAFLIRTSILGRFCAELCERVTGMKQGATTIADIERRHLLIVALDTHGRWFRYHALFAEFLHARLREREPSSEPELHRRASEWFESAGLWVEAVRHALAAGDQERAIDIVDRHAMGLIEHGEYVALIDWLTKFPRAAVEARPRLLAAQAWALGLTMRHDEARRVLARIRELYGRDDAELSAAMDLVHGGVALLEDDFSHLDFLDTWDAQASAPAWIGDVHKTLAAYSLIVRGEYRRARDIPRCETPLKVAYQKMLVGLASWHEGDGRGAEAAWTDALEYADEEFGAHSVTAALARAISARLSFERGNLIEAQEAIDQRLAVIEQSAPLEWLWAAYSTLAWAHDAAEQRDDAKRVLEHACTLAQQRHWARMEAALRVDQLRQADTKDLSKLAAGADRLRVLWQAAGKATVAGIQTMYLCEIGLGYVDGFNRVGSAGADTIASAVDNLPANASAPLRAQGLLMLAQVLDASGDRPQARTRLAEALAIGERLGLRQTFRTADRGIVESLFVHERPAPTSTMWPSAAYLDELRTGPSKDASAGASPPEPTASRAPVSDREREILMLVSRGMSNKEIGRSLRIGPETVKWHLKNLFAKLGVPNRIQAVNRARALSMI
ncbi:MAG TPA: LuxR C-terminal-related transcriptional regulator [Casimicrobiaceae bacterium]|nr:LuxR C-terminal-related transcriptional regulator [Casimicrobiaceae bacterium]